MRNQTPGIRRSAALGLLCLFLLQACTVSGAGFLKSNNVDELEPYAYPLQHRDAYTITVLKGDTLYSIAQSNQIDLRALIDENNLIPPYALNPGDVLRIPAPRVHAVARGETIYSISKAYGIDIMTLASLNGINAPYDIGVGDKLQLPGDARSKKSSKKSTKTGWRLGGGSSKGKSGSSSAGKSTKAIARKTPRGGGRFLWPVHGTVISTHGAKGGGRQNDGINIAVPLNAHVVAADDGTVTYVGNELRGYGNLVLIRHRGNWVSAYAHNNEIWVKKGEAVKRGEHIANAGQTGDADKPQVHFELRRGSKSIDPEKYLNME